MTDIVKYQNPKTGKIAYIRLEGRNIVVVHTRSSFVVSVDIEKPFTSYRTARRYCKRKGFTKPLSVNETLDIAKRVVA